MPSPNYTDLILRRIHNPHLRQRDIARTYSEAIYHQAPVYWLKVNQAIIHRWSHSGLNRIKTMAWTKKYE